MVKRLSKLVSKIERLRRGIDARIAHQNKLVKDCNVGDLLSAHTNLFNWLLEKDYSVSIDLTEWVNATNAAVAVWGDGIAPKPRA